MVQSEQQLWAGTCTSSSPSSTDMSKLRLCSAQCQHCSFFPCCKGKACCLLCCIWKLCAAWHQVSQHKLVQYFLTCLALYVPPIHAIHGAHVHMNSYHYTHVCGTAQRTTEVQKCSHGFFPYKLYVKVLINPDFYLK